MAGTINDILINCTETLTTTARCDSDGASNAAFVIVGDNDQIQVGMTISGLTGSPVGVLVKTIEKVATGLKISFGAPADNAAANYSVSGSATLTFTNEGPTPTTRTSGSSSLIDNSFVNTGVPGDKSSFIKTFTADTDHIFKTPPSISLKDCANPADYTIAIVDTKNSAGFLTARQFTVTVKINKTSSSDTLTFDAKAEAGFNPSVNEITNYSLNTSDLPWHGGTRELKVYGDEGAKFKLRIQKSVNFAAFSDKLAETTYTIPTGGVYTKNIRFGKVTSNTYFQFTISEATDTSLFVELVSPETIGIHQIVQPVVRSYSSLGTTGSNNQGAWVVSGTHTAANASTTGSATAYGSSSLRFSVTARNTAKHINYNAAGAGFTNLGASGFTSSVTFNASSSYTPQTDLISFHSSSSNPATAWSSVSGGNANDISAAGGALGKNINKLGLVSGTQRTFITRNLSTGSNSNLLVSGNNFSGTSNWDRESGVSAFTADAVDINPTSTAGYIVGKLNSPYLEEAQTYALTYTVATAGIGNGSLILPGVDASNGDVVLPTSIGTHTVYFTQGSQIDGSSYTEGVDFHTNSGEQSNHWLRIQNNNTSATTTCAISDISLKKTVFETNRLSGTTALKLWNGTKPENFILELTAANPRLQKNMEVRGVGVNSGTYIKNIEDGKYITLSSSPASSIAKGITVYFYEPATIVNASDLKFVMTQGTNASNTDTQSNVTIEGQLKLSSIGAYDVDIDLDLGAFIEADTVASPTS